MALLAVAVVFGGGGVGAGLFNLVVQLLAILLLALNSQAVADFVTRGPRLLVLLVAATLALPLIQTIPLPPELWQTLPGRDLVVDSLAMVDSGQSWFPWSVDSGRTLLSAISLLPCIAVLVLAQQVQDDRLHQMFWLLVWLGLVNLAFGAVQLVTGNIQGNFYPGGDPDTLFGTFANHNSTALFLDIAVVAILWLPGGTRDALARGLRIAIAAVLALGVLLTQSRSGTALLAITLLVWLASFARRRMRRAGESALRRSRLWLVAAVLAVFAVGLVVVTNAKLDQTFERFERLQDIRPLVWKDALVSAKRFWPAGSGISTFDEVFQVDESLEYLDANFVGRAHNDYLELVIESGVFGIALAATWAVWIAARGRKALKSHGWPLQAGALLAVGLIALQSGIDYPLRNEALLCVAAFMVNILARIPERMVAREVDS